MTLKIFKKKLIKIVEANGEFVVHTQAEMSDLSENQIVIAGQDETEVFTFEIIKVI